MQFTNAIFAIAAAAGLVAAAPLEAQSMTGDLTFYTPGLGACGVTNGEGDAVVALGHALFDQFTPGTNPNLNTLCGKQLQITSGGVSVVVTVEDRCVACDEFDLDVPVAIFSEFADPGVGRIQVTWDWL
ncbi:RlpA-like double-psi beta-barrel-protein domain-containing protein-containing protein [Xylaria sp. CBS 124048]|nr:RlpA-like double-psi beta-barrel-protein domain-containing protein-containing protein [Xylaria sp. CBS 124048]